MNPKCKDCGATIRVIRLAGGVAVEVERELITIVPNTDGHPLPPRERVEGYRTHAEVCGRYATRRDAESAKKPTKKFTNNVRP